MGMHGSSARNLTFRTEDMQSGKKENLVIPLNHPPENLVIETQPTDGANDGSGIGSATQADELLHEGKLPANMDKNVKPKLSYLRGVESVQRLFSQGQHNEALIRLSPLLEQYPDQARLFLMQGTLYRKIGEKKMASLSFKRARELDPGNPLIDEALMKIQDEMPSGGDVP